MCSLELSGPSKDEIFKLNPLACTEMCSFIIIDLKSQRADELRGEHGDSRSSLKTTTAGGFRGWCPSEKRLKKSAISCQKPQNYETWALLVNMSMDLKSLRHRSSINDSQLWIIDISDSLELFLSEQVFSPPQPWHLPTLQTHIIHRILLFLTTAYFSASLRGGQNCEQRDFVVTVPSSPSQLIS